MRNVLVNFEIPPDKLAANRAHSGLPIQNLRQIGFQCSDTQDTQYIKDTVGTKALEDALDGQKYPTMNFIDMFVARDQLTEVIFTRGACTWIIIRDSKF